MRDEEAEYECMACQDDDTSCPHCRGDSAETVRREMRAEIAGEDGR